ncbi:hypothetical protein [Ferrimonas sp. SCSIO 43195]|uniref:hypothetical protein n=1 Tax=Ferrimonas sp. SCSIO 43195 TaxID=2822844 RepID=UPI002074F646|nr:hypothetical protein [Ferrimonas sp. SCSIO 43195]USD37307.1 hypothetical protein J8Z22_20365 [Ferrimonas sp. SCSIO 43195]
MSGLGIFSGIEVLFFWLGVLCLASVQAVVWLRIKCDAAWGGLVALSLGLGLMIFDIAFGVAAVLEKEPQAASMSVMVMFLPGLLMAIVGVRLAKPQLKAI